MSQKTSKKLNIAFSLMILLLVGVLHYFLRPANDDFYYATFTDSGFSGFVAETVNHCQTVMGRVVVHIVLCPLLMLDMIPFKVFNIAVAAGLSLTAAKLTLEEKSQTGANFSLFLALFWLMGAYVLCDGALWGAGALNYLFPSFLAVLYYYLFNETVKKPNYLVCVLALITSATTEMSGITVLLCVVYLWITTKGANRTFCITNLVSGVLGYVSLFVTGGAGARMSGNETESLTDTIGANFSIFARKILDINGLGILVLLTMVALLVLAFKKKNKAVAISLLACCLLCLLVITGVLYHLWQVVAIAVLCFGAIWAGSVISRDKTVIFFMICLTVSLGICMVSPVVGDRMLFPCGVYLCIMSVRALSMCEFSYTAKTAVASVLCIGAVLCLGFLIGKFSANAKIVDKNLEIAKNHTSGELVLESVPDELYGNGTVPSTMNFGDSFMAHYGIENTQIIIKDDAQPVTRNGVKYVPVRMAKEHGADVKWRLACAEISYKGKTYRFSKGARVADTGLTSYKISHPVRMINGTTYIAESDFNNIFK